MMQPPESHDVRISRPELLRQFVSRGRLWSVWESADLGPSVDLVFVSEAEVRRVRDFPENWHELSVELLDGLRAVR